jgi:4-amino-4-deoxy-L-arabinose transferase-like glycosyltransferase
MNVTGLTEAVERRPKAAFAAFMFVHGVIWTALPALLYVNLPLDLIEALLYGREWQLGYDKLPPLPWWMVEIAYRTFGIDTAYYALAQIAVITAFVAVWQTARPLVGATGALVAILILDGMHYFNFTAAKFNHDVIQLPFWALAGFAFHAALRRGRLGSWIVLGVALGLALWAKYFVVVLAAPLALFMLIDPEARRRLAGPGPWIAAAVALIVMSPHIVWLLQHDFLPFQYVETRALPSRGLSDYLLHPVQFFVGQLFALVPSLLIATPLLWPKPPPTGLQTHPPAFDVFDRRIVTLLAFGPAAALLALTLVTGRGTVALWGYPLWLFLGLWIVLFAPTSLDRRRLARVGGLWAAAFTILAAAFVADYTVLPGFDHRYRAAFFPGEELSTAITQRYEQTTSRKLTYVIASMWIGGNIAHYSPQRPQPRVLIDGLPRRAPWIDLADLYARGAVLVWTDSDPRVVPPALATLAPGVTPREPFDLPLYRGDGIARFGWAILPARSP